MSLSVDDFPRVLRTPLRWLRVDFQPARSPSLLSLIVATVVALAGSLLADALLVKLGEAVYPSTKGYAHFQFSDYSKLTIIGVLIACVSWPLVTRVTSSPRWLFFRAALAVTLVLFLPDLWIWHNGSPGRAVFVLIWLHVAIALVTYNALVHVAPARRATYARHAR